MVRYLYVSSVPFSSHNPVTNPITPHWQTREMSRFHFQDIVRGNI
jgi:hypothetical protein